MSKAISPIAAQGGQRVTAKVANRCSCSTWEKGGVPVKVRSVTCPVHGDGRAPGRGK